jgi:hypothetical protein
MSNLELENAELKKRVTEMDSRYNSLKLEHNRALEKLSQLGRKTFDLEKFKTVRKLIISFIF